MAAVAAETCWWEHCE